MGPAGFFPTNPDLANILSDTDFDFENLFFWDFFVICYFFNLFSRLPWTIAAAAAQMGKSFEKY